MRLISVIVGLILIVALEGCSALSIFGVNKSDVWKYAKCNVAEDAQNIQLNCTLPKNPPPPPPAQPAAKPGG